MSTLIRAVARQCTRPIKALVYPLLAWLVRRVSQRFASDIQPVEQLALQVRALNERQDKLEGIYWDRSALVRRLAVIEDQLESLLNCATTADHQGDARQALRCVRPECERPAEGPDEPGLLRTG